MTLKELRRELSKYPADVLTSFAITRLDPMAFSRYPATGDNVDSKVQFLIEYFERKNNLAVMVAFAEQLTRRVRRLLIEGYSEAELYRFCYDTPQFKDVALSLGIGGGKQNYINTIIEECDRFPNKYAVLFAWMRIENPARYAHIMQEWD